MSDYRVGDRVVGTAITPSLGIDNGMVGTVVEVVGRRSDAIWVQFDNGPQRRWALYDREVSPAPAYPAPGLTIASIKDVLTCWDNATYSKALDALNDIAELIAEYENSGKKD